MDCEKFQFLLKKEIDTQLIYLYNVGKIESYTIKFEEGCCHYSITSNSIFNVKVKSQISYFINTLSNELKLERSPEDLLIEPLTYNINNVNTENDIINIAKVIIDRALENIAFDNYSSYSSGVSDLLHEMKRIPDLLCAKTDSVKINRLINETNQNLYNIKISLDKYLSSINYINHQNENNSTSNEELINNKNIINIEDAPCPQWVKRNINLGSFGENIAEKYLKDHYKKVNRVSLNDDSLGYDIEADNKKFEVKTSTSNLIAFHFTNNQLKVAKDILNNYNLFYIYINNKNAQSYGFIINNPIEILNLHNYDTSNISDSDEVIALLDGLFIQPNKDYIEKSFHTINLNNYLFE